MKYIYKSIFSRSKEENKSELDIDDIQKNIFLDHHLYNEKFFVKTGDLDLKDNEIDESMEYSNEEKVMSNEDESKVTGEHVIMDASKDVIRKIKRKKRKKDINTYLKNTDDNVIELENVSKSYLVAKNKITQILDGLNLSIKKGEFVVLFGKSGSGKSTLLNIMSGLDRATSGNVVVVDTNLPYLTNSKLAKFRRENLAFIFQQYNLLNNITGYENVETGAILQKNKKNIDLKKMFEEFDLLSVMNKYPSQMSGGQQQRISIMRALAKDADIIFADEPTSALDKKTGIAIMEMLQKINKEQNKTIVMVSHDPNVIKYASRKIFLSKGKIISDERI